MKTDIQSQMNAEKPDDVLADLEGKSGCASSTGSGTWIRFDELTPNPATKRWAVTTKDDIQIGTVKWYGPWRKYCFFPMAETVYEQVCLRDIASFCETETKNHRAAKSPNDGVER